jgi:hypothetical protein
MGRTPLHDAAAGFQEQFRNSTNEQQHDEVVEVLLQHGAVAYAENIIGRVTLLFVNELGQRRIVTSILADSSSALQANHIAAARLVASCAGHADTAAVLAACSAQGGEQAAVGAAAGDPSAQGPPIQAEEQQHPHQEGPQQQHQQQQGQQQRQHQEEPQQQPGQKRKRSSRS